MQKWRRPTPRTALALMALVLVVGSVLIVRLSAGAGITGTAGAGPTWDRGPFPSVPAGAGLIPLAAVTVMSPITVAGGGPTDDAISYLDRSDELDVWWGPVQAPQTSGATAVAQGRLAHQGYTVTTTERVDQQSADGFSQPPAATSVTTTVAGRPATLWTASAPPSQSYGVQAVRWMTWRIADGRYVHAWLAYADTAQLSAFAITLVERPHRLPARLSVHLGPIGSVERSTEVSVGNSSLFPASEWLCPAGTHLPSDGSLVDQNCFSAALFACKSPAYLTLGKTGAVQTVSVDGKGVQVDVADRLAFLAGPAGLTVVVQAPESAHVSALELAAVVASVRFDPTVASC